MQIYWGVLNCEGGSSWVDVGNSHATNKSAVDDKGEKGWRPIITCTGVVCCDVGLGLVPL